MPALPFQFLTASLAASLALLLALAPAAARAQDGAPDSVSARGAPTATINGVVWTVPSDTETAVRDLAEMHALGVRAVRTGLVATPGVLTTADTLGMMLFQEIDARLLPAERLVEREAALADTLAWALRRARLHPSAKAFGLAQQSDTSDPRACPVLQRLADAVREAVPEAQVYYTTRFFETDVCTDAVDFVLLETLEEPDPVARLARWRAAHDAPVGIATLGIPAQRGAHPGREVPGSPEAQARYVETQLAGFRALDVPPAATFVYRWRDAAGHPQGYGLFDADGTPRPLRDVVAGFYEERQTVFAFPSGRPPLAPIPWGTVFGWGLVLALSLLYATSPRFRQTLPRYFRAHGFYRETLMSGRGVLGRATVTMLLVQAMIVGLLVTLLLRGLYPTDAFEVALRLGPGTSGIDPETARLAPWMGGVFAGALYAIAVVFWAFILGLVSRRGRPLHTGQLLMLIVWPRWSFGLVLLGVMVAAVAPPSLALYFSLILGAVWFACYALATLRTLIDHAKVTRAPLLWTFAAALVSPAAILGLLILGAITLMFEPEVDFLQNLMLNG